MSETPSTKDQPKPSASEAARSEAIQGAQDQADSLLYERIKFNSLRGWHLVVPCSEIREAIATALAAKEGEIVALNQKLNMWLSRASAYVNEEQIYGTHAEVRAERDTLRAQLATASEVIGPLAAIGECLGSTLPDDQLVLALPPKDACISVGDCRKALEWRQGVKVDGGPTEVEKLRAEVARLKADNAAMIAVMNEHSKFTLDYDQKREADNQTLRSQLVEAVGLIDRAAKTFRFYEQLHLSKGTEEGVKKAQQNADNALVLERWFSKIQPAIAGLKGGSQ